MRCLTGMAESGFSSSDFGFSRVPRRSPLTARKMCSGYETDAAMTISHVESLNVRKTGIPNRLVFI
jgi:hypothetical protein